MFNIIFGNVLCLSYKNNELIVININLMKYGLYK